MKKLLNLGLCVLAALLLGSHATNAWADVRLPSIFADSMVLQRGKPITVWGWAEPGEKVIVSFNRITAADTAGPDGAWSVRLNAVSEGGPYTLTVNGNDSTATCRDVLVGDIWLCSGQSNMAMTVRSCNDFEEEQQNADLPNIRMFTVARQPSLSPEDDCEGAWAVCSPDTVGGFSATGYFFGREIHEGTGVPIGLIHTSCGATAVEAWTDPQLQVSHPELAPILEPWADAGDQANQNRPGCLYNGMIRPLAPYTLKGAIWYQGERNSKGAASVLYGRQLALLIENWRDLFQCEDMPFGFVQLPNSMTPQEAPSEAGGWVMVREGMAWVDRNVDNTGMAVTLDVGVAENIHPKNKQAVGKRLALWALDEVYNLDIVGVSPYCVDSEVKGNQIILTFDNADKGLTTTDGRPLRGFAIAGEDMNFVWADARINGSLVVVSSSEVENPVAVRYAWAANPEANLCNKAGLLASPFRTDDEEEEITGR
jgi:sialate O-acetylesterase